MATPAPITKKELDEVEDALRRIDDDPYAGPYVGSHAGDGVWAIAGLRSLLLEVVKQWDQDGHDPGSELFHRAAAIAGYSQ